MATAASDPVVRSLSARRTTSCRAGSCFRMKNTKIPVSTVALYNTVGEQVMVERGVNNLDVSNLVPGVYYVQTIEGETTKLIVE